MKRRVREIGTRSVIRIGVKRCVRSTHTNESSQQKQRTGTDARTPRCSLPARSFSLNCIPRCGTVCRAHGIYGIRYTYDYDDAVGASATSASGGAGLASSVPATLPAAPPPSSAEGAPSLRLESEPGSRAGGGERLRLSRRRGGERLRLRLSLLPPPPLPPPRRGGERPPRCGGERLSPRPPPPPRRGGGEYRPPPPRGGGE